MIGVPFALKHSINDWLLMDSISQQGSSISAAQELQALRQQHAALQEDQLLGQQLQQQLRPANPWQVQGVNFEHCIIPALHLAGDTLDYLQLPDGRLLLYLADVSGSGSAAALVTLLLKSTVQEFALATGTANQASSISPASLLSHLNQRLLGYAIDRHATLICAIVDPQQDILQWSVAGHLPPPILYTDTQAEFLEGSGLPVGLFAQATYRNQQLPLPQLFSLSLFTDGVFDALPQDSLVGSEAALPALVNAAQGTYTQIVKRLGLANCTHMPDDIAVLVLSRGLA